MRKIRTALITGAAKRLGAVIATELHDHGYRVIVHYRHSETDAQGLCEALNRKRPDSAWPLQGDLLDTASLSRLVENGASRWGRLDVLVNNASAFYPTPVGTVSECQWEELIGSNLKAPFFLIQAALPWLREAAGCVVNLADIYGERPLQGYPVFSIAKAGLIALTKAMAKELAPEVRVNAIAPGAVLWPVPAPDAAVQKKILARIPLARLGTAEEVARAVRFLADEAAYVTGQVLAVDGGRSLSV